MVDLASVQYLPEIDSYPAKIPRLEDGWWPTGGLVDPANDSGLMNWQAQLLAQRTKFLYQRHLERQITAPITMTVGPGGTYATLNQALAVLSLMQPKLQPAPITATVKLLAGYEMAEQVIVRGLQLGWVSITSVNPTVLIRRASLVQLVDDHYPAFAAVNGGSLPRIAALFSMTTEGPATWRDGIYCGYGGSVQVAAGCGVQSAGAYGALALQGGSISAEGGDFRNAALDCVRATRGGIVAVMGAILTGAGENGVVSQRGGVVDCNEANVTGAGQRGIYCGSAGRVNAKNANARRGANNDATDIFVEDGGWISAPSAVGGTNIALNTLTVNGVILR